MKIVRAEICNQKNSGINKIINTKQGLKLAKYNDIIITYEDYSQDIVSTGQATPREVFAEEMFTREVGALAISKKVELLKQNALMQGIYISEIFLDKKDYFSLIDEPTCLDVRKVQGIGINEARKHFMWDGVHIVNNSLPLPEKKCLLNKAKEETKLVAEQLGYHKKLLDTKRSLVKISNSLIAVISKLER